MSQGPPPTPPQHGLPAASHPFPGSLTPGWNDPPAINAEKCCSNTAGRTKLNKRVPFPLQQGLAPTTKPTAIVQPCQATTTTLGTTLCSGSSNIAVVHPMQYQNPAATLPANTGVSASSTFPRESQTPPPASSSSFVSGVPSCTVPAMPRGSESSAGASSIQHI